MGHCCSGKDARIVGEVFLVVSLIGVFAQPGFAQSHLSDHWSGSIQCQLDVEQQGYSRHESQTWSLTGSELPPNGDYHIYGANWTYTGRGATQKAVGSRTIIAQWLINVPPTEAPLALFVRNGKFLIRLAHSRKTLYNAVTGTKQISVNGVPQLPSPISSPVDEWPLPWIETTPGPSVNGTLTIETAGIGGDLPSYPVPAICAYQFAKADLAQIGQESGKASRSKPGTVSPLASAIQQEKVRANCTSSETKPTPLCSAANTNVLAPVAARPAAPSSPDVQSTVTAPSTSEKIASTRPDVFRNMPIPAAPTGFTATPLSNGAVKLDWQPVSGARQYRFGGPGIASSGLYVPASTSGLTLNNIAPGPGTWRMAAVYANNSWDPNLTATATAMVRYMPAHSTRWLSKNNGPGSLGATIAHYTSLCSMCVPGVSFATVMKQLGLPAHFVTADSPSCSGGNDCVWMDNNEAFYTNVTEFGTSRVTRCWNFLYPPLTGPQRIVCYSRSGDHGLTVIVKQGAFMWFLTFASSTPESTVFDWWGNSSYILRDHVTLDSEGPKYPPHPCLACHGGQVATTGGPVSDSTLLPLDPGLIGTGGNNNFNLVNKTVMDSGPSPAVSQYLRGLYGDDPRSTSASAKADFVPQGWASQAGLYRQVIKPHCQMCHLASTSTVDFSSADSFFQRKQQIHAAICSAHSMPHAEFPYKQFWTRDTGPIFLPGVLDTALGYQSCP